MATPISLIEARWNKGDNPADHTVLDMLRVLVLQIERGEIAPNHAIVAMGVVDRDALSTNTEWRQSGNFNGYEQYGLLERVKFGIMEARLEVN